VLIVSEGSVGRLSAPPDLCGVLNMAVDGAYSSVSLPV
jgi:hypothetical protein